MMKITKYVLVILASVTLTLVAGTGVALAATATYDSTDVPVAIPDNTTVTSILNVPCGGAIIDVNVALDITHTFDADLDIFLIAPDGTTVELTTDNGGGGNNYTGTIFDDEAATSITAGTAPFTGSFQPEGLLSDLDGRGGEGTWTLEITDDAGADTGTLNSWSLTLETTVDGAIPSTDVPVAITDNATFTSTLTLCESTLIKDVNVEIDITHNWDDDLDIFLIAPDGTRVELATDIGGSGDNFTGTIFDDEAATPIPDSSSEAPFTGYYQPEGLLSVLDGMTTDGTWTLEISDDMAPDPGTLNSWSLTFGDGLTFISGLPSTPAGITSDPVTGNLYYVDFGTIVPVPLYEITPAGVVTQISADCSNGGALGGYPYVDTDIQFLNGIVYIPLDGNSLVACDATTGIATPEHSFTGLGIENGIATNGTQLFVDSGTQAAGFIRSHVPGSGTDSSYFVATPPAVVRSMEHVKGTTYFWSSDNFFYKADPATGGYTQIPLGTPNEDFLVTPDQQYLMATNGVLFGILDLKNNTFDVPFGGFVDTVRHDMTFTKSSSENGCSAYVVDGTRIVEFPGYKCSSFPWTMFLPAIMK